MNRFMMRQFKDRIPPFNPDDPDRLRRIFVGTGYLIFRIAEMIRDGDISNRARSLVYTTLLTFVPLLALSFSILKSLGVHSMLHPIIVQFLSPLGDRGITLAETIVGYVGRVKVGVLGAVGLTTLLYTVTSTISQIEDAINSIWHVRENRGFTKRIRDYLSIVMIGPVLIFSATGIITAFTSNAFIRWVESFEPFGTMMIMAGKLIPCFFIITAFTVIYMILPNTRVRFTPALTGGIAAGLLWQIVGRFFAQFAAGATQYSAIYSGFAIVLLFMIWLYANWMILLIGAKISFHLQYPPTLMFPSGMKDADARMRRRLILVLMCIVGDRFLRGEPPVTRETIIGRFRLPVHYIDEMLLALVKAGLIHMTAKDHGIVPAKSPDAVSIGEIIASWDGSYPNRLFPVRNFPVTEIDKITDQIDAAAQAEVATVTLGELIAIIKKEVSSEDFASGQKSEALS